MAALPDVVDPEAFYRVLRRPEPWVDAIAQIRRRHGLTESFAPSPEGSTVVFLSERRCIKLHPPLPGFVASHRREVAALGCLDGALPIPTPALLARGELEGWKYFVSTRLPGRPIDAIWDHLDPTARRDLAAELGRAIAQLHRRGCEALAVLTAPWPSFVAEQRERCLDLERSKGLPPERLAAVAALLQRLDTIPEPTSTSALLHTEIGPSHVLVEGGRISGLIDFGDAMVGDPEYDLAPVGMFVTRGDPAAFRAFCLAYGMSAAQLADPERPARLLRHALLHRYGTLAWYLEVLSPPAGSLDDLAMHWFGVD